MLVPAEYYDENSVTFEFKNGFSNDNNGTRIIQKNNRVVCYIRAKKNASFSADELAIQLSDVTLAPSASCYGYMRSNDNKIQGILYVNNSGQIHVAPNSSVSSGEVVVGQVIWDAGK